MYSLSRLRRFSQVSRSSRWEHQNKAATHSRRAFVGAVDAGFRKGGTLCLPPLMSCFAVNLPAEWYMRHNLHQHLLVIVMANQAVRF